MQFDEGAPPPPPPSPPGAPAPPPAGIPLRRDNTIALAGLMVSVLGLVLSIIVVGGFLGLAGFGLGAVGLQRSRKLEGRGRLMAVGGMVIGLIAIALSVLGFFWIVSLLDDGEQTVIDGIRSNTADEDHPPQADVDRVECGSSATGLVAQAMVTVTNRSDDDRRYTITVEWDRSDVSSDDGSDDGDPGDATVSETFTTGVVESGETDMFQALEISGTAIVESCRVVEIDRVAFPFLSG